jgi:hypothetical protein
LILVLIVRSGEAAALFVQTSRDFEQLRDILNEHLSEDKGLKARVVPTLLATPIHHWSQSRGDFAAQATALLKTVLSGANDVILCQDCNAWRLNIVTGQKLQVNNGDWSLSEISRVKETLKFQQAKSLTMIRETPSGIELRVVELADGRVLLSALADGNSDLDTQKPWLGFSKERDRRLREEALAYSFINLGLYPNPLLQLEFVEQWGSLNQHITGIGLSLINPDFALGVVYHYLLRNFKNLHVSGSLMLPLSEVLTQGNQANEGTNGFVFQVMGQYAFSKTYALGLALSSEGKVSLGLVFHNPLFFPFIL